MPRIGVLMEVGDMDIPGGHFVPRTCVGETCRCGEPATHKVAEEIDWYDQMRNQRHPFTAYVCCRCFRQIMGDAVACDV